MRHAVTPVEALTMLDMLERFVHWCDDEANEADEAILILASNLKNSFAALAMMLGLVDHHHLCATCTTLYLEDIYDDEQI